jgi:vacuolar-type H+-ATPase subunit F/Vma7
MVARVAAIGEAVRVQGFALGGALVFAAEDADAARSAWSSLDRSVVVVILTPAAVAALEGVPRDGRLTVVMPR